MTSSDLQILNLMNVAGESMSAAQIARSNFIAKTAIKTTKTT